MVINVLRFLGVIDDESNKTPIASSVFSKHGDDAFSSALGGVVKAAYKELFAAIGDDAWQTDRGNLIGFFRVHDETSALTATRQAIAFETLASLSGHGGVFISVEMQPHRVGGIVGRLALGSFHSGKCGGTVERLNGLKRDPWQDYFTVKQTLTRKMKASLGVS